jgi:hypothetical protein
MTTGTRKRTRRSDVRQPESESGSNARAEERQAEEVEDVASPESTSASIAPEPAEHAEDQTLHDDSQAKDDQAEEATQPQTEAEPERQPQPEPEPTPRTRRSKRTTTVSPSAPAPAPTPGRRSTRQSSIPPSPRDRIPGSYIDNKTKTNIPESVPEHSALQPPTPSLSRARKSRTTRDLSAAASDVSTSAPLAGGRSRMTRSASRATLGEPEDEPTPKRARSRRLSGASEMSVPDMSMTPATGVGAGRRTTRQAQAESERGSPTPSVRSMRAGSQTPRKSTRAKK